MSMGFGDDLLVILAEAAEIDRQESSGTPSACRQCGTPLNTAAEGGLFCPFDGLRWPEDAAVWGEFPGGW